MRVNVIQVDGKMPNLACLKIRSYHRQRGDSVEESWDVDRAYISCVFPQNRPKALGIAKWFSPKTEILLGGSGLNLETLPPDIENVKVDWNEEHMLYAMGFTSRGCIRKCPFCIVWQKEGSIREHHSIEHISNGMTRLVLLDGNLLASPLAIAKLKELRDQGYRVNFNQGLDLRLVTPEIASILADIKYSNWHYSGSQLHFAWDFMRNEKAIRKGLGTLLATGIPPRNIMVYILCGYKTEFFEDMYRFKILSEEFKVLPFVMLYNNTKNKQLRRLARWVNRRLYKSCSWEGYRRPRL